MAQKRKYKRYATGGRFKQSGQGLQTSLGRIREQAQTTTDALRLQAAQAKEIAGDQIRGLEGVARSEAENARSIQELENQIYNNKYKAIEKRADREVSYILDQAKIKGQEAKFWSDFSTKWSKELYKGAKGLTDLYQFHKAKKVYDELHAGGYDPTRFPEVDAYNSLTQQMLDDPNKDWTEKDIADSIKIISMKNNHWFHMMMANDFKTNINSFEAAVKEQSGDVWNRKTANELLVTRAYLYLQEHGINPRSKAGHQILSLARSRGISNETQLNGIYEAGEDQKFQENLARIHLSVNTRESFESLVKHIKNGHRFTKTEKGYESGGLSWSQAYEIAGKMISDMSGGQKDLEKYLNHAIPGTDWISPLLKSTPTEYWTTKHERITNDILDHNDNNLNNVSTRIKRQKERDAFNQIADLELQIKNKEIDLSDFSENGDVAKLLNIAAQPNTHEKYRDKIYELTAYNPQTHGEATPYLEFQRLVKEEPWNVTAINAAYLAIAKGDRDVHKEEIENNYQAIKELDLYTQTTGFDSKKNFESLVKNENKNLSGGGGKAGNTWESGSKDAALHMNLHFQHEFLNQARYDTNGKFIPVSTRIENATKIVLDAVEQGDKGIGVYAREPAQTGSLQAVWTNFVPTTTANSDAMLNSDVIGNSTLVYSFAFDPKLNKSNLSTYLNKNKIVTSGETKQLHEMAITGDFDKYDIPENISRLSAITNISESDIINTILMVDSWEEGKKVSEQNFPVWPKSSTAMVQDITGIYIKNEHEAISVSAATQQFINTNEWPMNETLKAWKEGTLNIDPSQYQTPADGSTMTLNIDGEKIDHDTETTWKVGPNLIPFNHGTLSTWNLEGIYWDPYDGSFVDLRTPPPPPTLQSTVGSPIPLKDQNLDQFRPSEFKPSEFRPSDFTGDGLGGLKK